MRLLRLSFFICFLSAITANAQFDLPDPINDIPLTESELKTVFSGQTHRGTYSFQRLNFESFGFEETTSDTGQVTHVQDGHTDTGTYKIEDNQICFNYEPNERGEFARFNPICFNIYQRGNCYYHYQRSVQNTRTVRGFTARSVIKGDTPSCAPQIS